MSTLSIKVRFKSEPNSRYGMTLVVCWSFWGLFLLSFALYKQIKKRKLMQKEQDLGVKKNEFELYNIVRETKQNKTEGKYTIPVYEDFEKKKKIKKNIESLENYIKTTKEEGWD